MAEWPESQKGREDADKQECGAQVHQKQKSSPVTVGQQPGRKAGDGRATTPNCNGRARGRVVAGPLGQCRRPCTALVHIHALPRSLRHARIRMCARWGHSGAAEAETAGAAKHLWCHAEGGRARGKGAQQPAPTTCGHLHGASRNDAAPDCLLEPDRRPKSEAKRRGDQAPRAVILRILCPTACVHDGALPRSLTGIRIQRHTAWCQ